MDYTSFVATYSFLGNCFAAVFTAITCSAYKQHIRRDPVILGFLLYLGFFVPGNRCFDLVFKPEMCILHAGEF